MASERDVLTGSWWWSDQSDQPRYCLLRVLATLWLHTLCNGKVTLNIHNDSTEQTYQQLSEQIESKIPPTLSIKPESRSDPWTTFYHIRTIIGIFSILDAPKWKILNG